MARISRKQLKQDDFVEAAVDASHWLESNWKGLVKWVALALVGVLAVAGWLVYVRHQRGKAEELLGESIRRYERAAAPAEIEETLKQFEQVTALAGKSPAGRLARFYRGVALYRLGRNDEALAALREAAEDSKSAPTLSATARVMLAQVQAKAGHTAEAIALLTELAEQPTPDYPPEQALLRLGEVHQQAGDLAQAQRTWKRVIEQYPQTAAAQEARTLLGVEESSSGA